MPRTQFPRHVKIGSDYFRIDIDAEVPYRAIYDSQMVPRADISGVPGGVNLQRDVWVHEMSEFVGGEGRLFFDSSDPIGPPTFFKTEGGIDVRIPGEFSLHPDEHLVYNQTGGGSAAVVTTWSNGAAEDPTGDFTTVTPSPEYGTGPNADRVRLGPGEHVRAPARNGTLNTVTLVQARFVNAQATPSNKLIPVELEVWNNTGSVSVVTATATLRDQESVTLSVSFTEAAATAYHYRCKNTDAGSGVFVDLRRVQEQRFATGPASPQDIRALQLGINDNVWALAYDGTNTDVLRWDFSNDDWDQIVANMDNEAPRGFTGSDQYMYALVTDGNIWRINGSGATDYANPPTTANVGEELGLAVSNNKLYALYQQALFELTLDSTSAGLPFDEGETDYTIVVSPGEFEKELSPDTNLRQHITSISGGVRWFVNVRGGQTQIYEFRDGSRTPIHQLPSGYIATAIHHYANLTFIAAQFTNAASTPADSKTGVFIITADNLLRFLGYLRFHDSNAQPVQYISSYGHDVYFLQGRRLWRYSTGTGGLTLENEIDMADETKGRAMARMDKKFWVAVEGQGTFVADDSYSTTTAWLYSPIWDFDLGDNDKVLLGFDILTRPLPAATQVDLEYKIDEAAAWTSAGTVTLDGATKTRFTVSTGASTSKFREYQWRCGLTSLDGVDTPRVKKVAGRAYVLDYERSFDLTLLCEDDTSTGRLISEHKSGRAKAAALKTLITTKNLTTFQTWFEGPPQAPMTSDTYSSVVLEDPFQELGEVGQGSFRLRIKVIE